MPIRIVEAELPGVLEVHTDAYPDERGFFSECYSRRQWAAAGLDAEFVQDNLSLSRQGVLRGMHYQLHPHGMGKLIRVLTGAAFDVLVDLRRGSPAFGQWMGRTLTAEASTWLWAPVGFAHGFLALCDDTRLFYRCTSYYAPEAERALSATDPAIGIRWPFAPRIVSAKDAAAPLLADAEFNFSYPGATDVMGERSLS